MARGGRINSTIVLQVKFYLNGALIDPSTLGNVRIMNAKSGGSVLATLTPVNVSTGLYKASWTPSADVLPGVYYDEWTWTAESAMASQTRTYSFKAEGAAGQIKKTRGPLFVGLRELDFFNCITKELIQKIISQKIIYYSVSEKHTNTHRLYDEAIKKTVFTPVEVNALILYNEPIQTSTQFSIDTIYSIEVYFHYNELEERNIIPREGDFVKFGKIVYEIEKLNQPQIVYGQIQNKVMVKAVCRVTRKSQFEVLDNIPGYEQLT